MEHFSHGVEVTMGDKTFGVQGDDDDDDDQSEEEGEGLHRDVLVPHRRGACKVLVCWGKKYVTAALSEREREKKVIACLEDPLVGRVHH